MKNNRRNFIKKSILAGAAIPFVHQENSLFSRKKTKPLKILILGGTSFLGPHQIAYALERGHSISTFTRGKTKPTIKKDVFKKVEQLIGDRENDLSALKGKKWDAVIDNSGNKAEWTQKTAELLKDNVGVYLYTSSTGVYYPYLTKGVNEASELVLEVPSGINKIQEMEYGYGVMKAKSEKEATKVYKDKAIIVRPTYMVGPGDKTDRFIYWPVRLAHGGDIFVPGKKEDPIQMIDVRDVAEYMIRQIEDGIFGISNAVGPASDLTNQEFVYGAHAAFSSPANYVHVEDYDFLAKNEVFDIIPWIMPTGENYASARVSNSKAIEQGLTFRPLAKTVSDSYAYWNSEAISKEKREKFLSDILERENVILSQLKK